MIIQGIKEVEGKTVDRLMTSVVELCDSIGVKVENLESWKQHFFSLPSFNLRTLRSEH
jgi:hypothetical protein